MADLTTRPKFCKEGHPRIFYCAIMFSYLSGVQNTFDEDEAMALHRWRAVLECLAGSKF